MRNVTDPRHGAIGDMNRWIVGINMFHFDLVHIPGEHHMPNGLSRRPAQPGDVPAEDDKDEFEDWIDSIYGFLNIVLPPPYLGDAPLLASESNSKGTANATEAEGAMEMFTITGTLGTCAVIEPLDYATIPRSQVAKDLDARIQDVQCWLELGELPPMNFHAWEQWQKYASQFFAKDGKMWEVTREKSYQRVLEPSQHVLMRPLRPLCTERCLSQVQRAMHKHPREVDKQHEGVCKDSEACDDGNACNRSDARGDSNARDNSMSSCSHALIKHASEGELGMQCSVHERQHINAITCVATGAARVQTPEWDRGASHARRVLSVVFTGRVSLQACSQGQ